MANKKEYSGLSQIMDFMTLPVQETEVEEPVKEKQSTETVAEVEPEPVETPKKKKTVAVSKRKSTATPRRKSVAVPDGYKKNTEFIEKRTRRVQLYFQQSIYDKALKAIEDGGFNSMNDYIHYLVEQDTK